MKRILRNPKGSRDWLPDEVAKQEFVRKSFVDVFELWGFKPIQTPILINANTLTVGSNKLSEQAFKLIGQQGEILALRADLTTPIARVTAERLYDKKFPFKFYYVGKVFRYHARKTTNERELYQIGIELIGSKEGISDIECFSILIDSLNKLGLKDFSIIVNHSALWSEIFKCFGDIASTLHKALSQKDFILFNKVLDSSKLNKNEKEFWKQFVKLKGSKESIKELKSISKNLKKLKIEKVINYFEKLLGVFPGNIEFDSSFTSDMDYYTGVYFEVITPFLGRTIGAGGRYDQLISRFGLDSPAIGFSLCLEDVLLALENQGADFPSLPNTILLKPKKNLKQTIQQIQALHKRNKIAGIKYE